MCSTSLCHDGVLSPSIKSLWRHKRTRKEVYWVNGYIQVLSCYTAIGLQWQCSKKMTPNCLQNQENRQATGLVFTPTRLAEIASRTHWITSSGWRVEKEISCTMPALRFRATTTRSYSKKLNEAR